MVTHPEPPHQTALGKLRHGLIAVSDKQHLLAGVRLRQCERGANPPLG